LAPHWRTAQRRRPLCLQRGQQQLWARIQIARALSRQRPNPSAVDLNDMNFAEDCHFGKMVNYASSTYCERFVPAR
jgi:hypothetical protein